MCVRACVCARASNRVGIREHVVRACMHENLLYYLTILGLFYTTLGLFYTTLGPFYTTLGPFYTTLGLFYTNLGLFYVCTRIHFHSSRDTGFLLG